MTRIGAVTVLAAFVGLAAIAAPARAEPDRGGTGGSAALAEALFVKAKSLMTAQQYDKACPMFEESQRLDPAGGTLLALALCHERQGRTATAWVEFREAEAVAVSEHEPDREVVAKDHLEKLEPRLCRLAVRVGAPAAATPGLEVRRDGVLIARPSWGLDAPIDPGPHRVEASAPHRRGWSTSIVVGEPGKSVAVEVPVLDEAVTEPPPIVVAPPRPRTIRTAASIALGGSGVTALGIGAVFGVMAIVEQRDANQRCPETVCNDARARQENQSARSHAVVADVLVPVGLLASAGGILLFVTAPRSSPVRVGLTANGGAVAFAAGSF